jgi:hypothetical protein
LQWALIAIQQLDPFAHRQLLDLASVIARAGAIGRRGSLEAWLRNGTYSSGYGQPQPKQVRRPMSVS